MTQTFNRPDVTEEIRLHDIWLAWWTLNHLATSSEALVSSPKLRAAVQQEAIKEVYSSPKFQGTKLVDSLIKVGAIGVAHQVGTRLQKVFLTKMIGESLLRAYVEFLAEKEVQTKQLTIPEEDK